MPRKPSTSRLGRASTQPAGERSFIANPLPLKTNDDPPTPSLERPATLLYGTSPAWPIRPGRQTATRSRPYQYASPGNTLSTSATSNRSPRLQTQPDAPTPTNPHWTPTAQIHARNKQKNLDQPDPMSHIARQLSPTDQPEPRRRFPEAETACRTATARTDPWTCPAPTAPHLQREGALSRHSFDLDLIGHHLPDISPAQMSRSMSRRNHAHPPSHAELSALDHAKIGC